MRKLAIVTAAALGIGALAGTPADARPGFHGGYGGGYGYGRRGIGTGAAIGLGIAGLAAGAAASNAYGGYGYGGYGYGPRAVRHYDYDDGYRYGYGRRPYYGY